MFVNSNFIQSLCFKNKKNISEVVLQTAVMLDANSDHYITCLLKI